MIDKILAHITPEMITSGLSLLIILLSIIKVHLLVKQIIKDKNVSVEDTCKKIENTIEKAKEKDVKQLVEPLSQDLVKFTKTLETFAKVLCLQQENTPESRLAILECIKELGTISANLVDKTKQVVENEVAEIETFKAEQLEKIETVINDKPVE